MTPIVHIGLLDAGEAELQHWFKTAPEVAAMFRPSGDQAMDRAHNQLLMLHGIPDEAAIRATFDAAMAGGGLPVLSNAHFSAWRRFSPEESAERVATFFPNPKVIFITRRTQDWARARYFDQLFFFQWDTYAGINPWLEKHMSRLRVGSHIAPARWRATLERFRRGAGVEEVLILPYEMLQADRAGFIASIEAFTGLEGALARAEAQSPAPPKRTLSLAMANAYRMLGLKKRDPEAFAAAMALFNRYARKKVQERYAELMAQEKTVDGEWIAWFRRLKAPLSRAIDAGDEELISNLRRFDDYELRPGLAEYLAEIEAEETAGLLSEYGADLRPWGYAPAT
jgi:hypothetical protein